MLIRYGLSLSISNVWMSIDTIFGDSIFLFSTESVLSFSRVFSFAETVLFSSVFSTFTGTFSFSAVGFDSGVVIFSSGDASFVIKSASESSAAHQKNDASAIVTERYGSEKSAVVHVGAVVAEDKHAVLRDGEWEFCLDNAAGAILHRTRLYNVTVDPDCAADNFNAVARNGSHPAEAGFAVVLIYDQVALRGGTGKPCDAEVTVLDHGIAGVGMTHVDAHKEGEGKPDDDGGCRNADQEFLQLTGDSFLFDSGTVNVFGGIFHIFSAFFFAFFRGRCIVVRRR